MTPSTEETKIIRLLDLLGHVNTGDELISWVEQDLKQILPHEVFICGMGKVQRAGVSPIKFFASNFPVDYLRALKQPDGLYFSAAINSWLKSGEVQLLDSEAIAHAKLDCTWLERFRASGLQNIAAHGVYEYSRQHASYFSFHQMPEPLGERHKRLLNLLVPHMHITLLRILHNLKSNANVSPAHANRTLTVRELEVLAWVCEGKTSTEIASILGIASSTVRNQIQSILVKLRVSTRSQAAAKAIRKGLITPQQPDSILGHF
jgi:transcriptional regulator EpsA